MAIKLKQIPESNYSNAKLLKIRDNVLIAGNSIYPINNISAIDSVKIKFPIINIIFLIVTIVAAILFFDNLPFLALGCVLLGLFFLIPLLNHEGYAIIVEINSGRQTIICSSDQAFINTVCLNLLEVLKSGYGNITIDFSNSSILGSSINVGNNNSSQIEYFGQAEAEEYFSKDHSEQLIEDDTIVNTVSELAKSID